MTIEPISVLGVVIGLAVLYHTYTVASSGDSVLDFLLTACLGGVVVLYSGVDALSMSNTIGTFEAGLAVLGFDGRGTTTLTISNVLLLIAVLYVYLRLQGSEKEISNLNQEIALLRFEIDRKTENSTDTDWSATDQPTKGSDREVEIETDTQRQ